ncbi:MAG: peptide deformylase [Clostridiales Family XIII bacterium]|nr:peptide deformylase [Clostridiales Family XIII bacterium]
MALRKIVYDGEPLLRKQSREVKDITPRIRTLIEDMWETLYVENGVGLAAPQVGVLRRVIVIDTTPPPDDSDEDDEAKSDDDGMDSPVKPANDSVDEAPPVPQKYTLINPELVWVSEETQCSKEGCLSVPGRIATVTRPAKVRVKALDEEGQPIDIEADGLLAKALQHEIDHLNGIVIVDIADEVEDVRSDKD